MPVPELELEFEPKLAVEIGEWKDRERGRRWCDEVEFVFGFEVGGEEAWRMVLMVVGRLDGCCVVDGVVHLIWIGREGIVVGGVVGEGEGREERWVWRWMGWSWSVVAMVDGLSCDGWWLI